MNERQKALLRILLTDSQPFIRVEQLAQKLTCSEKTVRNDLNYIEEVYQNDPYVRLVRKQGVGISLKVKADFRATLFQQISAVEPITSSERIVEIAYRLLSGNKPVTLSELSEKYFTNKSIIKADLERISTWIEPFQLELVSKQRIGSSVVGEELHKRNALAHLRDLASTTSDSRNPVLDLFPAAETAIVRRALSDMQLEFDTFYTDAGLESLLIHALILLSRVRKRAMLQLEEEKEDYSHSASKEYEMTEWLLEKLEKKLGISFPVSERIYFMWHLLSSKTKNKADEMRHQMKHTEAEVLTRHLVEKVEKLTLSNFHEEPLLYDGLAIHLHSVIYRIKYGFPITNPLLSEIKKLYPYMLRMIQLALEEINTVFNLHIPEHEAAYLVLHFQAAMERIAEKNTPQKILIVCHLGVGISNLLRAKLENYARDMNIVDTIGKMDVKTFIRETPVDLIISTVELDKLSLPVIVVSPLLNATDKANIDKYIRSAKKQETTIKNRDSQLFSLLKKGEVIPRITLDHRFEIVELLANQLYQDGFVKKEFIHNALRRERESATGIGGAVAIPHAQPDLVKQSAVIMGITKKPVEWGTEKVSLVFLLAIANQDRHLMKDIIQHISEISKQPETVAKLNKAIVTEQVITYLSN